MSRIWDLVVILVLTIILSLWTSSTLTKTHVKETFQDIDTISRNVSTSGMNAIACAPSSAAQTTIRLGPTFNDLLATRFIKNELTTGLGGMDGISARTCSYGDVNSLRAGMNSSRTECDVEIDFQPYTMAAVSPGKLKVSINSTQQTLSIIPDDVFLSLLLHRPFFFVLESSRPYMINYSVMNPFKFSTHNISNVQTYKNGGSPLFSLPIRPPVSNGTNLFAHQTLDVTEIIQRKSASVRRVHGSPVRVVELELVLYCVKIKARLGDVLELPRTTPFAFIRRANDQSQTHLSSMLSRFTTPAPLSSTSDQRNPTISTSFTVKISKPTTGTVPNWMNNWNSLLKIGGQGNNSGCDSNGRGVLLVEMAPVNIRGGWWMPFREEGRASTDYVCLHFTNTNVDIISERLVEWCGGWDTRGVLWIPTGVNVDIAYIVSPSMKVMAATFFDETTRKKQLIFGNMYNVGSVVNGIRPTLRQIQDIAVTNLVVSQNMDPSVYNLSNVKVNYGMMDLHKWYFGTH